jgi:hypothetical protein
MSTSAKLLNKILFNRLLPHVNPLQSGFHPQRSTLEQIVTLRTILDDCRTQQRSVSVVSIDFQKAFDSVSRSSIPTILAHYGVPTILIDTIMDLYTDTTTAVQTQQGLSEAFPITSDVL